MKINVRHINQFGDKGDVFKVTKFVEGRVVPNGIRIRFYNRYLGRGL